MWELFGCALQGKLRTIYEQNCSGAKSSVGSHLKSEKGLD